MITNRELYSGPSGMRTDHIYVVTEPPVQADACVTVRVNLDSAAAVADPYSGLFPAQPTVSAIRQDGGAEYLLSGGAFITNERGEIAVGLRDENAADPLALTNIAAGRCDRRLHDHCMEEVATELILCVRDENGVWHQVDFGTADGVQVLLCNLNKPDVAKRIAPILDSIYRSGGMQLLPPIANAGPKSNLLGSIVVNWFDPIIGKVAHQERLHGYVLLDEVNHTTEFRLALQLDLSSFSDNAVFYGEGTGHAEWLPLPGVRALVQAGHVAGRNFVTPFLRAL